MAKLFTGKLPSDQREITIIEIENGVTIRSWDRGIGARLALGYTARKGCTAGDRFTVRNVVAKDNGRGEIVRELRVIEAIHYAAGTIPVDLR